MKTALCFSGKLGCWRDCFDSILEHIVYPLKPDIFLSTWDDEEYGEFCESYKPKSFRVKNYQEFNSRVLPNLFGDVLPNKALPPMLYNLQQVEQVMSRSRKNLKKEYDLVIRIRPDIKILEHISKSDISQCMESNTIKLPLFECSNTYHHPQTDKFAHKDFDDGLELGGKINFSFIYDKASLPNQVNDQLAIGPPAAMDKYFSCINEVRRAVDFLWTEGYPEYFTKVPESVFTQCLKIKNAKYSQLSGSGDTGNLRIYLVKDGKVWSNKGHNSIQIQ